MNYFVPLQTKPSAKGIEKCNVESSPILRGVRADSPWSVSRFSVECEPPLLWVTSDASRTSGLQGSRRLLKYTIIEQNIKH